MKLFWIRMAVGFGGAILLLAALRQGKTQAATPAPADAKRSVIVELFTSEGCSSCPPADALLGQLRQEKNANGAEVIPLGFHVDYWDSLGWRDRFDSPAYSQRQEDYARKLHIEGPYTPQMVVNGQAEFVGNDAARAREAIAQSSSEASLAQVEIATSPGPELSVKVKSVEPAEVMLAITEDNLATKVGAGENGGRTLRHSAVVRELRRLGALKDSHWAGTAPIKIEEGWKRDDLRAVVFVQEPGSGKILGAASVRLSSLPWMN
jgi:hypothetical protein